MCNRNELITNLRVVIQQVLLQQGDVISGVSNEHVDPRHGVTHDESGAGLLQNRPIKAGSEPL